MKNKKTYLFTGLLVIILFGGLEYVGGKKLDQDDRAKKLRQHLIGSKETDDLPILTGHPYLNYICTPNYSAGGVTQHNRYGYRGDSVSFEKGDNVYRILFLGGSTTYNVAMGFPDSTLPEQIKGMLSDIPANQTIEVMNGGILWGTSFEILSHYEYKYRYYKPDLLVVHTGGNDAQSYMYGQPYQADYTNWRKTFVDIERAKGFERMILQSRWIAYLVIRSKYKEYLNGSNFVHYGDHLITPWFKAEDYLDNPGHNAFYNNIRNLILIASADSADILLVPFIVNKDFEYNTPEYLDGIERNNRFLKQLAGEYHVTYCDITPDIITNKAYFLDDCHLTGSGIRDKARAITPYIERIIEGKSEILVPDTLDVGNNP